MEPENPRLDTFILGLTKKDKPRVCLIPTAGGDGEGMISKFLAAFTNERCEPSVLSLFRGTHVDIRAHLLAQDVIYVSGGNTRNMLALWALWGVDAALREAYANGVLLAGLSAGSICWFECGITDSWPGALRSLSCLGLLSGSHCPHYDGEPMRRPAYQNMVGEGTIPGGIAADDGVGLLYENEALADVVSSRPSASAWRVDLVNGAAQETRIPARFL